LFVCPSHTMNFVIIDCDNRVVAVGGLYLTCFEIVNTLIPFRDDNVTFM